MHSLLRYFLQVAIVACCGTDFFCVGVVGSSLRYSDLKANLHKGIGCNGGNGVQDLLSIDRRCGGCIVHKKLPGT